MLLLPKPWAFLLHNTGYGIHIALFLYNNNLCNISIYIHTHIYIYISEICQTGYYYINCDLINVCIWM